MDFEVIEALDALCEELHDDSMTDRVKKVFECVKHMEVVINRISENSLKSVELFSEETKKEFYRGTSSGAKQVLSELNIQLKEALFDE